MAVKESIRDIVRREKWATNVIRLESDRLERIEASGHAMNAWRDAIEECLRDAERWWSEMVSAYGG